MGDDFCLKIVRSFAKPKMLTSVLNPKFALFLVF